MICGRCGRYEPCTSGLLCDACMDYEDAFRDGFHAERRARFADAWVTIGICADAVAVVEEASGYDEPTVRAIYRKQLGIAEVA